MLAYGPKAVDESPSVRLIFDVASRRSDMRIFKF